MPQSRLAAPPSPPIFVDIHKIGIMSVAKGALFFLHLLLLSHPPQFFSAAVRENDHTGFEKVQRLRFVVAEAA